MTHPWPPEVVERLYDELKALAHAHLRRERTGHTIGTTGLVHEAWLRVAPQLSAAGDDPSQFFAAAANTMRRVLVDHARHRQRAKRGGGIEPVPLDEATSFLTDREADELLSLVETLDRFASVHPRACAVVVHRFFGGLSEVQTAEVLGVSSKTVQRDWLAARAWLRKEIAIDLGLGGEEV